MTVREYLDEHHAYEGMEDGERVLGSCEQCGEDVLSSEHGYMATQTDRSGKESAIYLHKECFMDWVAANTDIDDLADLLGLKKF